MAGPKRPQNYMAADSSKKGDSCLVTKLAYYINITNEDRTLLVELEKSERTARAGEDILFRGDRIDDLFVVKYGWFFAYTMMPDGNRLVVRVYHAGDVIGLSTLAFRQHTTSLQSITAGCLCPFAKADLETIFTRSPKISALFFTLASREEAILVDTLLATGRMPPEARVAYPLLGLHARLKITDPAMSNRFRLPLTQTEIGDAIGLSNVTVSRTLARMEKRMLLKREKGEIELMNLDALGLLCDFQDRHEKMDVS